MATLRQKIDEQIKILAPLIGAANETKKKTDENHKKIYSGLGTKYKNTQEYKDTISLFYKAHYQIDHRIGDAIERLKSGDRSSMPTILAYLSIAERYFRSGYTKEEIIKQLKNIELTAEEKEILKKILLEQFVSAGSEFNEFVKLYPILHDQELLTEIKNLETHNKDYVIQRVARILELYEK